jgi:hypothetical protein
MMSLGSFESHTHHVKMESLVCTLGTLYQRFHFPSAF